MVSDFGYKLVHLFGLFLMFTSLGAMTGLRLAPDEAVPAPVRRVLGLLHGVALLLVLLGGFGMMARLGLFASWPVWIWLKLTLWLLFGASVVVVRRAPRFAGVLLWALPLLGGVAAWVALHKPFAG